MNLLTLAAATSLLAASIAAQQPGPTRADVWGHAPTASDDRFSNPKKPLYAGPDGWFNTGEVRATVANAAKTPYKHIANFQQISGDYEAVKDLQTLHFDFGSAARPQPGTYKVGSKGNAAQKLVHLSFGDVTNKQINDWSAQDGAGTLTVSLVNGFTYFRCRNVVLQPSTVYNKGAMAKPLSIGFEGALKPE